MKTVLCALIIACIPASSVCAEVLSVSLTPPREAQSSGSDQVQSISLNQEDKYICPDCGWDPRSQGPMNREDTIEPLVAVTRLASHAYECPANQTKVAPDPSYPIRSKWWSGCSSWRHLTVGPHAGKFDHTWLAQLSNEELQSLHSDDHDGRVKWDYVVRGTAPVQKANQSNCPGGVCPPQRRRGLFSKLVQ